MQIEYNPGTDLPMLVTLTDEEVAEYKAIAEKEFGPMSVEEAREQATRLMKVTILILRKPNPPPPITPPVRATGEEHPLLTKLSQLKEELPRVKSRPTEWRWSVTFLWDVVSTVLVEVIQEKQWAHPPSEYRISQPLPESDLPKLFQRACRDITFEAPPHLTSAVKRLNQMKWHLDSLTMEAWRILAADLPKLYMDCLEVVAIFGWKPGYMTWANDGERDRAKWLYNEISALLFSV